MTTGTETRLEKVLTAEQLIQAERLGLSRAVPDPNGSGIVQWVCARNFRLTFDGQIIAEP